jgi:valyl-tRNA synthetase
LAAVLDGTLRLMHPMIPFVTETIWWKLNETWPERGLPGHIECPPSKRLIKAGWPKIGPKGGPVAEDVEATFLKIQEIIGAIRNARNEYKADIKKIFPVSILTRDDGANPIAENRGIIELLASCAIKDVRADLPPVANAARVSAAGCELFIEGLVDQGAERERSTKKREELNRQVAALRGRLSNAGYIAKAPPHLVEETKTQLAEAEAELAKLG